MTIYINNIPENIQPETTVKELLEIKNISLGGTAVAINSHIVKCQQWDSVTLNENDNVMIITAAYGG